MSRLPERTIIYVHHELPLHTVNGWQNRVKVFLDNGEQNLFGLCPSCQNKRDAEIRRTQRIKNRMNDLSDFDCQDSR